MTSNPNLNPNPNSSTPPYDPYCKDVVIGAAETIRDICRKVPICDKCPYYSALDSVCIINSTPPKNWVTSEEAEPWRALILY